MMNILIVKTSSLGDIVQAFPVLHYLHERYPHVKIDWIVEKPFVELVQAHPYVNQVLPVQTRKWRFGWLKREIKQEIRQFIHQLRAKHYDIVFDLQGNVKSGILTACSMSPLKVGFGYATVAEWPNILFTTKRYNPPRGRNIREDYLFLAQSASDHLRIPLQKGIRLKITPAEQTQIDLILSHPYLHGGLKILVCPGSNWTNKQLPLASLKTLLQNIHAHLPARFLFVWGSSEEKCIGEELCRLFPSQSLVIDKLSLPVLQNLMAEGDLVIAMDSLPLHLADTTSTPTYSVFGASSAEKYKPIGEKHHAFQGKCPYGKVFEKRCPILRTCPTGSCIKSIPGDDLFNHFIRWWQLVPKACLQIHNA